MRDIINKYGVELDIIRGKNIVGTSKFLIHNEQTFDFLQDENIEEEDVLLNLDSNREYKIHSISPMYDENDNITHMRARIY